MVILRLLGSSTDCVPSQERNIKWQILPEKEANRKSMQNTSRHLSI